MALIMGACIWFPATLCAWNLEGHTALSENAVKLTPTFEQYAASQGLVSYVPQAVLNADKESEKVFTADLDKAYPGIRMIRGEYPTKVQHTSPILAYYLPEDTRLHNAIECLKISHQLRLDAATADEHRAAMRIFCDGLHLVQDYFAHLNAPGRGKTGFSHGVGNLVDTDDDGTPDLPAGKLVDNVNWDCHSDHGNDLVPPHLRVINYFYSPFWHRYPTKEETWRYQAALQAGIEYMECYLAPDGPARFVKTLEKGYVERGGQRTYLDLITHIAADNRDPSCLLTGEWESMTMPGCFMDDSARTTVGEAPTSATWSVAVPLTGRYDIYLRWPSDAKLTTQAKVTVNHNNASQSQFMNQQVNGNRWNTLGRYSLTGDETVAIRLTAAPGESIAADAVLLVRVTE